MSSAPSSPIRPTASPQRTPRLQVLPGTWSWLLLALAMTLVGAFLGVNLLLLFGYILLLIALGNVVLAIHHAGCLTGKRRIVDPLYAGRPFRVEMEVTNQGSKCCRGLEVADRGPGEEQTWLVAALAAGETCQVVRHGVLKRGRHTWGDLWAGSTYPFGLFRRAYLLVRPEEVLVLPALGRLRRAGLRRLLGPRGASQRPERQSVVSLMAQAELHGVRDCRPGDNPRAIHWRTSARRGHLVVREFEEPPSQALLVLLDPVAPSASAKGQEGFEAAISLAATLCQGCARDTHWLGLLIATPIPQILSGVPDRAHVARLLAALAVVQPGPRAEEATLRAVLRGRLLGTVAVALVACKPSPLEEVARSGRRTTVFLSPADPSLRAFYEAPAPAAPEGDR